MTQKPRASDWDTLPSVEAGSIVGGRFELLELLGRGAMGDVYKARDRELGVVVALKLMGVDASSERFVREAEVLESLHDPHIVRHLADAYIQVGYYREAVTLSRESLAEAEDTHVLLMAASAKSNLARGLCVLGELTEARAVAEECAEEMRRASEQRMEGWVRRILVTVLLRLGELEKAAQEARRALEIPGLPPPTRAICLAHLADVFLAQGLPADADVAARSAMDLLEEIGQLDDSEAYVRLVHAQVLFASQRYDEAGRAILAARTRLSAIAASMGNAYFRESFLRDVPEHAKTLELAAAWCD